MGIPALTGLGPDPSYEDVVVKINSLVNELRNALLTLDTVNVLELNAEVITAGSITADKIGANEITADKMNVNQLSAISADLGHITAGTIEAVQIFGSVITGTVVQTKPEGQYPRTYIAGDDSVLEIQGSGNEDYRVYVAGTQPIHILRNNFGSTVIQKESNQYIMFHPGDMQFNPTGGFLINGVNVISEINSKANAFSGVTGSVSLAGVEGQVRTLLMNNGVITDVI